jgi:hypothetical protein
VSDVCEGDGDGDVERASGGTASSARSRLSMDSTRSVAKRWMANWRAESMSRLVRSWRLRKSAMERRYLSCLGGRGKMPCVRGLGTGHDNDGGA